MKRLTLSAGAVPYRKVNDSYEYLLLRSYSYWDFPKGMVETGEDPWEAAAREVQEETGLSEFSTPFGTTYLETEPYGKGKVARYYIVEITDTKKVKLLPNPVTGIIEHHGYRWVSYEDAKALLQPRVLKILDWAHATINS